MRVTIKTRRDTEANWTLINPKLALGEMGIETDTKKIKFGDGNSLWNDLQYVNAGSGGEVVAEDIDDRISELLVAGSGINLSYSDENDSLTISTSGNGGDFNIPVADIDLHNGGVQSAQVLQFNDPVKQSVITGPTPDNDTNAQRLIIQGQRGQGTGEGGDVYFWAGDADTNGGDIKIYAGDADNVSSGQGGYVNIDGGNGYNQGGSVSISAGNSTEQAGDITITAGNSPGTNGVVYIRTDNGINQWSFNSDGSLDCPNGATIGYLGEGFPGFYNTVNSPIVISHFNTDNQSELSTIVLGASISGSGGDAKIVVESSDTGYHYWDFKSDGSTNLPDGKPLNFGQNIDTLGPPVSGGGTDRVRLWDFQGEGSNFNYAIGAEGNHVWFAMDVNDGTGGFKFYSRDTEIFKISDDSKLVFPNGTTITQGTFDNSTGGNNGISLNCYVGYELNWQGGHLKSTIDNGATSANILCDSAIELPGAGLDNMEINSSGLIFPDGTTQSSANGGNPFDQNLNTFDSPTFNQITVSSSGTSSTSYYVMCGVDGITVTSLDGLNWNGPYNLNMNIHHVATDGNTIVAIDDDNVGYTSFSNPSAMTLITATVSESEITSIDLNQIIYGGGYFVVAGEGYDGTKYVPLYGYSSDGLDWVFKIVEGELATVLANNNNENCEFSDIDYNGTGWNFAVTAAGVGGGVYTTDITETFTSSNYFSMVSGIQVAWNGNAWYYINPETGSGFNTSTDPRLGEWVGPYNPWASSQEDLGILIIDNISDTFCGGNSYLVFSDSNGHISFSNDNGQNWIYKTPIPYTATITNISYVDSKYQLSLSGDEIEHGDGEKITISGSSVSEYNGTYYLDDENFLYIDFELTIPWVPEIDPFSGSATLTWSHGMYIDAMDYVNGYFYIGNDDEQIARSSDCINWTIVDDRNNAFEYWNDFSGYTSPIDSLIITPNTISNSNSGDVTISTNNHEWSFSADSNLNIPGNILLSNGTTLAPGTFDNSTGGNGGISLNCYVGYELNWQGGHLKSTQDGGITSANIYCDSAIEFQGSGSYNVQIDNSGIIFTDGTTLDTANHNHTSSYITDFNTSVSGLLPVKNIIAGDNININNVDGEFTISVTGIGGGGGGPTLEEIQDNLGNTFLVAGTGINLNYSDSEGLLTIATSGVSFDGHTHTSNNITDFASSVSGLLPVKDIISGTGISVSSTSGVFTIDSSLTAVSEASKLATTVFNKTGSVIPKMSVVYINGGQGDLPTITLAIASGETTSSKTYGITAEAINDMSSGKVIVEGALTGLNTDQFNPTAPTGNVNGTVVYLSPTVSGAITTTKPSAPNHLVAVGTIVRTHQNEGIIEVRIQNGFELQELHNVAISGASSGQFLQFNGSNLWVPSSSGNFTHLLVNGTGVSLNGHTHTSSEITDFNSSVSGLLPVKNVLGSGYVNVVDSSGTFTVSVSGLQPSGNYSVSGHTHTSSQITDFNSSVSGLLPSNIIVSNIAGITGASTINNIVAISQANYDALGSYDPNTIYYIV